MLKRLLSVGICLLFMLQFAVPAVMAASFPDVDPSIYSWAVNQIEEMADKKIISGYPDGTFKPGNFVTRLESIILISRILGVEEESQEEHVELAIAKYAQSIKSLNISEYDKYLTYIIYKGLYTSDELLAYLGLNNTSKAVQRYEAAILLTKAMGAESIVKNKGMSILTFKDVNEIPVASRAYVEYVTKDVGLMKGMGDDMFGPISDVTRAQMAVMLYNVMDKLTLKTLQGTVTNTNTISSVLKFDVSGKEYTAVITGGVFLKLDGNRVVLSDIDAGFKVNAVYSNGELIGLECITVIKEEFIEGIYTGSASTSLIKSIYVQPMNASSTDIANYVYTDETVVLMNNIPAKVTDLSRGDHVKLTIRAGKIVIVDAYKKDKTASGTVEDLGIEIPASVTIRLNSDNSIQRFEIADDVTVRRNSLASDMRSIMKGDKVEMQLEYDVVTSIVATSVKKTVEGTIKKIVISEDPYITLKLANGDEIECVMTSMMEVTLNGQSAQIYDMRLGYSVKASMDSGAVTKLETQTVSTVNNLVGIVLNVNTSYMFINVQSTDGTSQQVFVKKNATIIDSKTQKIRVLKDVKVGSTITMVISSDAFTPEATTIVIVSEPAE